MIVKQLESLGESSGKKLFSAEEISKYMISSRKESGRDSFPENWKKIGEDFVFLRFSLISQDYNSSFSNVEFFDLKTRLRELTQIDIFLKSKNDWRRCTFRSDCFRCTVRILIILGPKYFSEAVKRKFPNRPIIAYVEARGSFNNIVNERNCNSKKKAELDQLKAALSVSHCSTEKENLGSTILTEATLELVNPYEKDAADNDIDDEVVFGKSSRKRRSNVYKRWRSVVFCFISQLRGR